MMSKAIDQRQSARITTVPHANAEGTPGHPMLVNVSQSGACLWLSEPPPALQYLVLRFQCKGRERILRTRIMWARLCSAMSYQKKLPFSKGWLAGIAFDRDTTDTRIAEIPHDILHAGHARVSFQDEDDIPVDENHVPVDREETGEVTGLSPEAIPTIKAATNELVPVFAQYFSDINLVFTRDRLELSASFRPPTPEKPQQIQQDLRRIEPRLAPPSSAPSAAGRPGTVVRPAKNAAASRHKYRAVVIAGAMVVILAAIYYGVMRESGDRIDTLMPAAAHKSIPDWAQGLGLDNTALEGWIEVKSRFGMPDGTARSVIRILQENDLYPRAHDLHDLAKYPVQAGRAFALLAAAPNENGKPVSLDAFTNELESRLIAGARFPDETPGGRYSSLQRELYNNVVVLGIVDRLNRRQDEPGVKEALAAIRKGTPANADAAASARPRQ